MQPTGDRSTNASGTGRRVRPQEDRTQGPGPTFPQHCSARGGRGRVL